MPDPPDGFAPLFRTSPFLDALGPFYHRRDGRALVVGVRIAEKHCNARGTAHGGLLMTLADISLGYSLAYSEDPPASLTTANLSADFAGSARLGDRLEARTDIQKLGGRLAFANAYISVGDGQIVRASAVFVRGGRPETAHVRHWAQGLPDRAGTGRGTHFRRPDGAAAARGTAAGRGAC